MAGDQGQLVTGLISSVDPTDLSFGLLTFIIQYEFWVDNKIRNQSQVLLDNNDPDGRVLSQI